MKINKIYDAYLQNNPTDIYKAVGWVNEESANKRFNTILGKLNYENGDTVLDYGCGCSVLLYRYLGCPKYGYVGVDINKNLIDSAIRNMDNLINEPTVEQLSYCTTVDEFQSDESKFKFIVLNGVCQDLPSIKDAINLINGLIDKLEDGGKLIILTPSNTSNRSSEDELFMSPFDLLTVAVSSGYKFKLSEGELGKHLILELIKEVIQ